jgi:hypothetical protein
MPGQIMRTLLQPFSFHPSSFFTSTRDSMKLCLSLEAALASLSPSPSHFPCRGHPFLGRGLQTLPAPKTTPRSRPGTPVPDAHAPKALPSLQQPSHAAIGRAHHTTPLTVATTPAPPSGYKKAPPPLHSLTPLLPHPRHRAENTPKPPWLLLAGGSSTTVTTMEVASRSGSHPTFLSLPLYSLMLTDLLPS